MPSSVTAIVNEKVKVDKEVVAGKNKTGYAFFIYSDKLPDSQENTGSMSNMIQHLLVAADRFGLDRLKHLCEAKFCEELNVDVVATTLSFAHDHHCSQLKTFCLNFAAANLRAVMQTEGYKYVKQTCPLLLSELLETVASVTVDERPGEGGGGLSRKRSGSSVMGLDLAAAQMSGACVDEAYLWSTREEYQYFADNSSLAVNHAFTSTFHFCNTKMLKAHDGAEVDIIDRLLMPFGLVRSGVAPDHHETKIFINQFSRVAHNERCSFFGNVSLGSSISL